MNGAPGVSIVAANPQPRPIAPARTDVAAFVGIAQRGPIGLPVRVTSLREFQTTFGSFLGAGFLAYAVNAFFQNGGVAAWIVRAAAPPVSDGVTAAAGATVTLAAPLDVLPGTLVAFTGLGTAGDDAAVIRTVLATSGDQVVLDAPLTGADPHEVPPLDLTQPVVASTGAVAAWNTLRAVNGSVAAHVTASSPGSWGNALAVRVMSDVLAQTTVVASPLTTADVLAVASVAQIARGTLVRLRQGGTLDLYRAVCDVDPVARTITLYSDDPSRALAPALNVPLPSAPSVGGSAPPLVIDVAALHVLVLRNGAIIEDYDDVSPVDLADFAAQLAVAGSAIALAPAAPPTLDSSSWLRDEDARPLNAGTDGTRMLATGDLLTGLAAVAPLREPTMIAIPDACATTELVVPPVPAPPATPGCTDPVWLWPPKPAAPAPPPTPAVRVEGGPDFDAAASGIVAQALIDFCDSGIVPDNDYPPHPSFRFALVDVPFGEDPLAFRARFDAAHAAIHWPWLGVYDPLGTGGAIRFVPPCGHVAGAFAATDLSLGVHHSAANQELLWVASVAQPIDHPTLAMYNDAQINCVLALPNRGIRIFGARTLSSDEDWLYVPVRRLVSMIENAILVSMQWAVFEPNTPTLRQLVRRSCTTLLDTLWQSGAFAGSAQAAAYYVICDGSNNPAAAQALGQLQVAIGVAPVRPAEFIVFRVGHVQDVLEVFEGAAA
jgi:phage tail sheath protein FI